MNILHDPGKDDIDFSDSGGESVFRATKDNPCNLPCPTCGEENKLTQVEVDLHLQCYDCVNHDAFGGF